MAQAVAGAREVTNGLDTQNNNRAKSNLQIIVVPETTNYVCNECVLMDKVSYKDKKEFSIHLRDVHEALLIVAPPIENASTSQNGSKKLWRGYMPERFHWLRLCSDDDVPPEIPPSLNVASSGSTQPSANSAITNPTTASNSTKFSHQESFRQGLDKDSSTTKEIPHKKNAGIERGRVNGSGDEEQITESGFVIVSNESSKEDDEDKSPQAPGVPGPPPDPPNESELREMELKARAFANATIANSSNTLEDAEHSEESSCNVQPSPLDTAMGDSSNDEMEYDYDEEEESEESEVELNPEETLRREDAMKAASACQMKQIAQQSSSEKGEEIKVERNYSTENPIQSNSTSVNDPQTHQSQNQPNQDVQITHVKRGRGRPPGHKNKIKKDPGVVKKKRPYIKRRISKEVKDLQTGAASTILTTSINSNNISSRGGFNGKRGSRPRGRPRKQVERMDL